MIPVQLQPEPTDFDERVRQPGIQALRGSPDKLPDYWTRCLKQLHKASQGICAYLCIYIPPGVGARSVEHFLAKSSEPSLAYEWSNYRLACSLMNSRKNAYRDVLDPFEVGEHWFILEFSMLQVLPNPDLDAENARPVRETIQRLKLNDQECLDARADYYDAYLRKEVTFELLRRRSPFVASEMERQGLAPH